MFGHKDTQTTAGPATVQAPSMLDNVSSDDFADGANPAVTEVEKQVKEALAVHQQQHLEQTLAAPASSPAPVAEPAAAVPATDDPVIEPASDAQPEPDTGGLPTQPESSETELVEAQEAVVPHALTSTQDDSDQNDLAHTVPGIQVHESSAETPPAPPAEDAEPIVSPSAPIQPPAQPVEEPSAPAVEDPAPPQEPVQEALPQESEAPQEPVQPADPAPVVEPADVTVDTEVSRTGLTIEPAATEEAVAPEAETLPEIASQTENVDAPAEEPTNPQVDIVEPPSELPSELPVEVSATTQSESLSEPPAIKAQSVPAVDPTKLAGLKQHALDHLEPLADKLEQTPEEEFRTTMMRIQANDNHTLLDKALAAAKSIEDDKDRAKALLDIVNEINYFSVGAHQAEIADSEDPEV